MYTSLYSLTVAEYIWIDGNGGLRSKTRLIRTSGHFYNCAEIPDWNYDGSSTFQASDTDNTEIILKPCRCYKNPLKDNNNTKTNNILVLCDTYDIKNNPTPANNRFHAKKIFDEDLNIEIENTFLDPWFGLEQEYYMIPTIHPKYTIYNCPEDEHYCGVKLNSIQRKIAEEHLDACIHAGIIISGINAEVEHDQWEFQIGPCGGIKASDDLYVARYLLERIAEKYNYTITYNPKPYPSKSGSGCHVNFSTIETREENGLDFINTYIEKLRKTHDTHKKNFGKDNENRLTGAHETADHNVFTWGVGTRNTSIRIGNQTFAEKKGYFEDRRPGANIDPYSVTSQMFKTISI